MSVAACPGCAALPDLAARAAAPPRAEVETHILSMPGVHCAGCIASVERGLSALPGVESARVNLSLRRAVVTARLPVEAVVSALAEIGYEARRLDPEVLAAEAHDARGRGLLTAIAVSGFAMMNVMLLSVSVWAGAEAATRDFLHWVSAAIALPAAAYAARPFFASAWTAAKARRMNMDTPISLAILLAAAMSLYETSMSGEHAYFDAALSLTFFLLLGRYLDHRTRTLARSAAQELAALEAPKAVRVGVMGDETVAVGDLRVGDLIRLSPGTRAPVDGVVTEGASDLDLSHLTGETLPAAAAPGARIAAGAMNLTGPLTILAEAVGEDSSLRRMGALVAMAEAAKGRYASLADRAAQIYAPGVHLLAFVAGVSWVAATGDARLALNIAVAVLIITCPCALGLAAPAVATAASGRLYRDGVLVKHATALERLAEVDTVVFDKTGTLTEAAPRLANAPGAADLAVAAALATGSAHPYARAVAAAATGPLPAVKDVREVPGAGIEGVVAGVAARLGAARWVGAEATGGAETWLKIGDAAPVRFAFADDFRPGAADLVATLKGHGFRTLILSGDGADAVADAAAKLGVDEAAGSLRPEEKLARLEALKADGRRVLMVGDGLNDAAALAGAHVSAAPASALDAARVAADIVILGSDLKAIGRAIAIARTARRRIVENFALAGAYNLIAVPIALAGFATPLIAALAMSASSITVSLNALRTRPTWTS